MRKIIYFCFTVFFTFNLCFADIIILKDGTSINGEITADTPDQICVKTEKKSFFVLKENIKKIIVEDKKNEQSTNWAVVWTASGLIIAFILIFLLAKAGNTY